MKEKIFNLLNSKLFFAVIVNTVILILCVILTSFSYDNSSDYFNSLNICHEHYYYSNEINFIYATIIGSIQYILPNFNCFVLSQIILSWVAFTTITFVLANKFDKNKALIFTIVLNVLFAINHYANILSSKTAAILITAGLLLLLNAIRNKKYNLPFWIGLLEILFGSFLCYEYFFAGIAFAIAYFFADMITKKKYKLPFRKFFWYFRPFVLVFTLALMLTIFMQSYSVSVNNSSDEAAQYYEYSELCDTIDNYPYPDYSESEELFNKIGINNSNDYEMLINGYYDKDKSLNNKALSLVAKIQKNNNNYNIITESGNIAYNIWLHIVSFDSYALIYIIFIIIAVLYILLQKKRFAFFPLFYIIAALCAGLYIRYSCNISAYSLYGIWLMISVFTIYSFDFEQLKNNRKLLKEKTKIIISIIVLLCLCISSFTINLFSGNQHETLGKKPVTLFTEINRHPERFYVIDPETYKEFTKHTNNYNHPMWGFTPTYLNNVDTFGFLHRESKHLKHNLPNNIYKAVLSDNNVFVIDKKIVFKKEKYLNEHYASKNNVAYYNELNDIDGYKIYQVKTE